MLAQLAVKLNHLGGQHYQSLPNTLTELGMVPSTLHAELIIHLRSKPVRKVLLLVFPFYI